MIDRIDLTNLCRPGATRKRRLIRVTRDDIKRGLISKTDCPIARAIRRDANCSSVFVTDTFAIVGRFTARLSSRARDFIYRFDTKRNVKPFNFYLVPKL